MRLKLFGILVIATFLFSSCDITSQNPESETLDLTAKPTNAGTVNLNGNQLRAKPEAGYFFQYWKINHTDGTISTITNDSTLIDKDNVKSINGVFGAIELESFSHLKTDKTKENVYFISSFRMPVDTASSKNVDAFIKYDVSERTKQKVFVSDKQVRYFDVSHDGAFIALSAYVNDRYQTYVWDINGKDLDNYEFACVRCLQIIPTACCWRGKPAPVYSDYIVIVAVRWKLIMQVRGIRKVIGPLRSRQMMSTCC